MAKYKETFDALECNAVSTPLCACCPCIPLDLHNRSRLPPYLPEPIPLVALVKFCCQLEQLWAQCIQQASSCSFYSLSNRAGENHSMLVHNRS